jgi:hypothetical protein
VSQFVVEAESYEHVPGWRGGYEHATLTVRCGAVVREMEGYGRTEADARDVVLWRLSEDYARRYGAIDWPVAS